MRMMSTPHLAELFHNPQNTELCKIDWVRAGRFLRGEYPQPFPDIIEWTPERTGQIAQWMRGDQLCIDTEYHVESSHLWLMGFGTKGSPIVQWWPDRDTSERRSVVKQVMKDLLQVKPALFQNCFADLPVLEGNLGIRYEDYRAGINDTMFLDCLLWCEMSHRLEDLARRMGKHEKLKHLPMSDPRYNAGDVAETLNCWDDEKRQADRDPFVWEIYHNELLPLVPIILEAQELGLAVDRPAVQAVEAQFMEWQAYARNVASAYCGFPLNLGSGGEDGQLASYLAWELGKRVKTVDEDAIALMRGQVMPFDPDEELSMELIQRRIAAGAHPLLEARVLYARATQWMSHYTKPMLASRDGRVHAHFHPWAQNTGRWSTVNPPLAQLPLALRHCLIPDRGWRGYEFDWDQIELRLLAVLARDPVLMGVFASGQDPHTLNACDFFGLPRPPIGTKKSLNQAAKGEWTTPEEEEEYKWACGTGWQGSDDPRRAFAKPGVYRLCYGGTPEGAPSIPGAMALGLEPQALIAASRKWIAAHPAIKRFWAQITQQALSKRQLRTFLGRRWNFLSHDRKRIQRQMYDYPMQGGVGHIMNRTLIAIKAALGDRVRLAYTMHDSLKLQLRETPHIEEDKRTIQAIAQQEWDIQGTKVRFPAEFHERMAA